MVAVANGLLIFKFLVLMDDFCICLRTTANKPTTDNNPIMLKDKYPTNGSSDENRYKNIFKLNGPPLKFKHVASKSKFGKYISNNSINPKLYIR